MNSTPYWRSKALLIYCAISLCATAGSAATFTWTGSASTDWFNATNWTPAGVPGPADTVNIASGPVNLSSPVTIGGQLNWSGGGLIGSPLTIAAGGALNLSGSATKFLWTTLSNAGTVTWAGTGNLQADYNSAGNEFGLIQNLAGGLFDIQTSQTLLNGSPSGAFFQNAGTVRKSSDTGTTTIAIPFNNAGTVTNVQGILNFSAGGVLGGSYFPKPGSSNVFSGGAFSYTTPPAISGGGGAVLTGGTLTLANNTIPNLTLAGGTITLGPGFQGGTITNLTILSQTTGLNKNTVLLGNNTVSGVFNSAASLPGSLALLSGAAMTWSGGSIQGPVNIAAGASLTISAPATVYLWGPLTNAGTVAMTNSGTLEVDYSSGLNEFGSVVNLSGALWDFQAGNTRVQNSTTNGAFFQNSGTVRVSAPSGSVSISVPFLNSGTVTNVQAQLYFGSGGTIGGSFGAGAGALIDFEFGALNYSTPPTITGIGIVEAQGGTLTLNDLIPNLQLVGAVVTLGPNFEGGTITNFTIQGGTLAGNYTVSGTFNTAASITGRLTLLSGASVTWSNGTIQGPITVPAGATLTLSGGGKFLWGPLTNAGTIEWASGSLEVDNSSANLQFGFIQNLPGGLFDIQNSANMNVNSTNGPVFQNAGTLRKSADTGTTTLNIPFVNSGDVIVLQGSLSFTAGAFLGGTLTPEPRAAINLNGGPFTYNTGALPLVSGAGTFEMTGGSLTLVSNNLPNLQLLGGFITLGPNFQGGTITNLSVLGFGTLLGNNVVSGTFNLAGVLPGSLTLLPGASATWAGGTIQGPVNVAVGASLAINGAFGKILWAPLTNAGTVTWSGTGDLDVENSSANNQSGSIQNLAGALWDIQNSQHIFNNSPNGAYFQNAGTFRKSADTLTTFIAIPFYNSGTMVTAQGTVNFSGGGTIGGAFIVAPGAIDYFSAGAFSYTAPPAISGGGTAELTGGSLTLVNDVIPNLLIGGGTIALGPNFQGGAITNLTLLTNAPPATSLTLAGNYSVSGTLNTGANLTGSLALLSGAAVNWSGGSMQGPVSIAPSATLTISGPSTKFLWGGLTNAGTVNLTGSGTLEVDYSSAINEFGLIQNAGLWNIQGDQLLTNRYTNEAYFQNLGTVQKSAGTNSFISIPFTNAGTAASLQGALTLNGGVSLAGGTLVAGLGAATNYGQFNIPGNAVLAGAFTVNFEGVFVPALSNSFALVTYGSHSGAFAPLTIPPGPNFQTNYGATNLTLSVSDVRALKIVSGGGSTVAGATLAPLVVQVIDALTGSAISTNGLPVSVSLASGATLGGTLMRNTDSTGKVTFNDLSINLAGTNILVVSALNTTPATNATVITAGPAAQLALLTAISSNQVDGTIFQPFAVVQVRDGFGNVIPGASNTITAHSIGSGSGSVSGVTNVNAGGTNSAAVFTNLYYVLGNQSAPESVKVYFSAAGVASVTNPPVVVNFILGPITLHNNNSVVQINPASQQGISSWTVDGVNVMSQEWFWLRQGTNGPQVSLDALGAPVGLALSASNAAINYNSGSLSIIVGFSLQGGAAGSQTATLAESVSVQNILGSSQGIHLFEYADFDLSPNGNRDTVSFPGASSVLQQGGGLALNQTVQSPTPSYWEAGFYPLVLDAITANGPATLTDTVLQAAPGDQTFADQWDSVIIPGQVFTVNLTQTISAGSAPAGVTLSIAQAGASVVISWPSSGTGALHLQSASKVGVPGQWSAFGTAPSTVGSNYQVTIPVSLSAQFFRLSQ